MKRKIVLLSPVLLCLCLGCLLLLQPPTPETNLQPINPLLGDLSFEQKFGHRPDAVTDEDLRIRTHLEYVEACLRNQDVSTLTPELRTRRTQALDNLHDYWTAGIFPRNYDYTDERRPCFIDRDGRICAVGYLVEQSAGRNVAEQINQSHQYDHLLAMNDATVDDWVAQSGLTKTECAMIQPTYGWQTPTAPNNNNITPKNAIASAGFNGVNLGISAVNGLQMFKGIKGKVFPIAGIVTGAGQIVMGALTMPKPMYDEYWGYVNNESQQRLSMLNIGMGSTSVVLGVANLILNRAPKAKPISWNLYGYPAGRQQMGMGFSLTKML